MTRNVLLSLSFCLLVLAGPLASAAPILTVENAPAQYVPGDTFCFYVTLADAVDLASYNIELVIAGDPASTPGSDYDVDSVLPEPPASCYVFGSTPQDKANYLYAVNTEPNALALTLSDFHDPDGDFNLDPVTTVADVNDCVAVVGVITDSAYTGPLTFSFDTSTLQLDNADVQPIAGFDEVVASLAEWSLSINAVPEPAGLGLLSLPAIFLTRRRRAI